MFASTAVLGALPIADPISISFAIFIWFVEVTLALGMVRVMRENHREIRRDLDRLLGTKSIKNEIEKSRNLLLNREFANYLHGSVQNQLISSALKIERNGNNPEVTLRELAEVERILESADKFSSSTSGATLLHQLKELKSNWAGFVEISIETSSDFSDLESITVQKLVQVANEGISNAVRHGHAENIQVHLTKTGTVIELSITDDGLGPVSKKPGLGTKFYNFVAPGNWSLNPDPKGGSILVLTLDSPLSATQL
jgi:signal transduction histidine kinase